MGQNELVTRAYNRFVVSDDGTTITKFSKTDRLIDEITYYDNIPDNIKPHFPRLLDSFVNDDPEKESYMSLEYYAYKTARESLRYANDTNVEVFCDALKFFLSSARSGVEVDKRLFLDSCESMYIHKTDKYYKDLVDNFPIFRAITESDTVQVNGDQLLNFHALRKEIYDTVRTLLDNGISKPAIIHGDFCFSNMLVGSSYNVVRLIDPRGSFGKFVHEGDRLYDYAKLMHSVYGRYDDLITDYFRVQYFFDNKWSFNLTKPNELRDVFDERIFSELTDEEFLMTRIIEGLIFIGMCSRHYDSEQRQLAMYFTGLQILNSVIRD